MLANIGSADCTKMSLTMLRKNKETVTLASVRHAGNVEGVARLEAPLSRSAFAKTCAQLLVSIWIEHRSV